MSVLVRLAALRSEIIRQYRKEVSEMALETEAKYYESIRSDLLKQNEGKFALIVGSELLGVFDRPETAYEKGIGLRGNVPMLIKPITTQEKVEMIPAMVLGLIGADLQQRQLSPTPK